LKKINSNTLQQQHDNFLLGDGVAIEKRGNQGLRA